MYDASFQAPRPSKDFVANVDASMDSTGGFLTDDAIANRKRVTEQALEEVQRLEQEEIDREERERRRVEEEAERAELEVLEQERLELERQEDERMPPPPQPPHLLQPEAGHRVPLYLSRSLPVSLPPPAFPHPSLPLRLPILTANPLSSYFGCHVGLRPTRSPVRRLSSYRSCPALWCATRAICGHLCGDV